MNPQRSSCVLRAAYVLREHGDLLHLLVWFWLQTFAFAKLRSDYRVRTMYPTPPMSNVFNAVSRRSRQGVLVLTIIAMMMIMRAIVVVSVMIAQNWSCAYPYALGFGGQTRQRAVGLSHARTGLFDEG